MLHSPNVQVRRDQPLSRPLIHSLITWAGILSISALVFVSLYLVVASLEP